MNPRVPRALVALALALAPVAAAPPARAAVQRVTITGISFDPQAVSILPGDSVRWENATTVIHTVTERTCGTAPCSFDEEMSPAEEFPFVFESPGIVLYKCRIHGFTGSVTIEDPPGALPDLAVEGLSIAPATAFGLPMPTTSAVRVTAANLGAASATTTPVRLEYRYRGRWHPIDEIDLGPLSPGARATGTALWDTSHLFGDFVVRAVVDPAGALEELREGNNAVTAVASLVTPPGAVPGLDALDPLG